MKKFLLIFLFLNGSINLFAQIDATISVPGLPTKEVYDLLVDKKGFLWIAHDLGLTRFDGISMVNFACPEQTSLSITDLNESLDGKIWCHNFSGQIFFFEKERLNLLQSYPSTKENTFPRIQVLNDELISTSGNGLFIYNIRTKKTKYLNINQKPTRSLAIIKRSIVAYGDGNWFLYDKKSGFKKLKASFKMPDNANDYLHPVAYNDTLYLTRSFSNELNKLVLKGDSIILADKTLTESFINTIVRFNGDLYINTKINSYSLKNHQKIIGLNLTDIVRDHEGNIWYGSLKNGLTVKYRTGSSVPSKLFHLDKNDFIRSLAIDQNLILCGTQLGELVLYDNRLERLLFRKKILDAGSIEKISFYLKGTFLVSGSIGNWVYDIKTNDLSLMDKSTVKDIDIYNQNVFYATSTNLTLKPDPSAGTDIKENIDLKSSSNGNLLISDGRCRAVKYNPKTKNLYVSLKDGLFLINKTGKHPVRYNNQDLHISSLAYSHGKIFASDFNNGLFIIANKLMKHFTAKNGLLSNTILKIKLYNDHLWIFSKEGIQLFDINKEKIDNSFLFPNPERSILYDISEINNLAYIATSDGLHKVELNQSRLQKTFQNYILYTIINQRDTLSENAVLPYYDNNIQINLSVPFFDKPEHIFFKYRLSNQNNENWATAAPNQRTFNYTALMPGNYHFEAIAMDINGNSAEQPVKFNFKISKPWWQQLWFAIVASITIALVIWRIVRSFYQIRIKRERAAYEQLLAVESERQRIGEEIHDDISAGLSAMKLHISLLEKKAGNDTKAEIRKVYNGIADLSSHLREVIWTLNTEHDDIENVIYYLQQQAVTFFENTGIFLKVGLPTDIPDIKIQGGIRKDIYLAIKETWQNVIKHAQANLVSMEITIYRSILKISVSDNGVGMADTKLIEHNGLKNINNRLKNIGGNVMIKSDSNGTTVCFEFPI